MSEGWIGGLRAGSVDRDPQRTARTQIPISKELAQTCSVIQQSVSHASMQAKQVAGHKYSLVCLGPWKQRDRLDASMVQGSCLVKTDCVTEGLIFATCLIHGLGILKALLAGVPHRLGRQQDLHFCMPLGLGTCPSHSLLLAVLLRVLMLLGRGVGSKGRGAARPRHSAGTAAKSDIYLEVVEQRPICHLGYEHEDELEKMCVAQIQICSIMYK